jgi:hypothetical protein
VVGNIAKRQKQGIQPVDATDVRWKPLGTSPNTSAAEEGTPLWGESAVLQNSVAEYYEELDSDTDGRF